MIFSPEDPSLFKGMNMQDLSLRASEPREMLPGDGLLEAIFLALSVGDMTQARSLFKQAESEYAEGKVSPLTIAKCRTLVSYGEWAETALDVMHRELAEDHFSAAFGHFREAINLSRGFPALRLLTNRHVIQAAKSLLPQNWRLAEALLAEASESEAVSLGDAELTQGIQIARREEAITIAIHKTERSEFDGKRDDAKNALLKLLQLYPGDDRLRDALDSFNRPIRPKKNVELRLTRTTIHSMDFASPDSNLSRSQDVPVVSLWNSRVTIPVTTWSTLKNFAATAAATLVLAVAGFLVWQHMSVDSQPVARRSSPITYSIPASANVPATPVVPLEKSSITADEQAWTLVKKSNSPSALRAFLAAYPESPHALRARLRVASLEWDETDKNNIDSLKAFAAANPESPYAAEAQRLIDGFSGAKISQP